jgi:arylsulfatase A-like enzyme
MVDTVAETFRDNGFVSRGIVANPTVGPDLGFGQGFDQFGFPPDLIESGPGRYGGEAVANAATRSIRQWSASGSPFFLWIHFMDPHGAYFPPEEFRAKFPPISYEFDGPRELPLADTNYGLGVIPRYQRIRGQSAGKHYPVREIHARYDAEIHYVDHHIGRVLEGIRDLGLWDKTAIVLTADHGESLGEHNYFFQHGWNLYEPSIRVPLMTRIPGNDRSVRIEAAVSLIDVAPTLLEIMGIPAPESMEGESLLGWTGDDENRPAFSQTYYGNQLTSLTHGELKLVFTPPPPPPDQDTRKIDGWKDYWPTESGFEFYNLSEDPRELYSLANSQNRRYEELRQSLLRWLNEQSGRHENLVKLMRESGRYQKQVGKLERNVRLKEQLRALGYLD